MWGTKHPILGPDAALYTRLTMIAILVSYNAFIKAESATAADWKTENIFLMMKNKIQRKIVDTLRIVFQRHHSTYSET